MKNISVILIYSILFYFFLNCSVAKNNFKPTIEKIQVYCWCFEMYDLEAIDTASVQTLIQIATNSCTTPVSIPYEEIISPKHLKVEIRNPESIKLFSDRILNGYSSKKETIPYNARLVFIIQYSDGSRIPIIYLNKNKMLLPDKAVYYYDERIDFLLKEIANFDFSCPSNGLYSD